MRVRVTNQPKTWRQFGRDLRWWLPRLVLVLLGIALLLGLVVLVAEH